MLYSNPHGESPIRDTSLSNRLTPQLLRSDVLSFSKMDGLRITSVFLSALVTSHVTGNNWMEEPYGDDSFNTRAQFNTNVTLVCNDTVVTDDYEFQYWIAPDMTIMKENYSDNFWTLDGWAGWEIRDGGVHLVAYLIQEAHFGFYYCVRERNPDDVYVIKKAINYKGPYWGDLWEKYETNTLVGLSASGGFLALCILIAITFHFRYHDDDVTRPEGATYGIEEYGYSAPHKSDYQEIGGYTNPAFEPIKNVGFSPVSPIDVHRVTGKR